MLLRQLKENQNCLKQEGTFFFSFFLPGGGCVSRLRTCLGARLLPQFYHCLNLSEGADRVGGQLRGDKECLMLLPQATFDLFVFILIVWIFCVNHIWRQFWRNFFWHMLTNKKVKTWLPAIYCTNVVSVPSSFVGKLYTHQRFCKYLLVSLDRSLCLFQLFHLYFPCFARFDNLI